MRRVSLALSLWDPYCGFNGQCLTGTLGQEIEAATPNLLSKRHIWAQQGQPSTA